MAKYKIGDKVKVVRGTWWIENNKVKWFNEDRIGSIGIVTEVDEVQGIDNYALEPVVGKGYQPFVYAWYNNNDLEIYE